MSNIVVLNGKEIEKDKSVGALIIDSFATISGSTFESVNNLPDIKKQRIQYAITAIEAYAQRPKMDLLATELKKNNRDVLATLVAPIVSGFDISTDFNVIGFKNNKGGAPSFIVAYTQVGWGKMIAKYSKPYVSVLNGDVALEGEEYYSKYGNFPHHIKNKDRKVTWDNIQVAYQIVRVKEDILTVEVYREELLQIKGVGNGGLSIHKTWPRKFALAKCMKEVYYTLSRAGHLTTPDVLTRILQSDENIISEGLVENGIRDKNAYDGDNSLSMGVVRTMLEEELLKDTDKVKKIIEGKGWAFDQLTEAMVLTIKEEFNNE